MRMKAKNKEYQLFFFFSSSILKSQYMSVFKTTQRIYIVFLSFYVHKKLILVVL